MTFGTNIFQFLDTVGDGSGTDTIIANYSSAATDFKIVAPAGSIYAIERLVIHYQTTGVGAAAWTDFGNVGVLPNGLGLEVRNSNDTLKFSLTNGNPITTNADWSHYCYDVNFLTDSGAASAQTFVARWTVSKSGAPIYLTNQESLVLVANDDFSATGSNLADFRVNVQAINYVDNAASRRLIRNTR